MHEDVISSKKCSSGSKRKEGLALSFGRGKKKTLRVYERRHEAAFSLPLREKISSKVGEGKETCPPKKKGRTISSPGQERLKLKTYGPENSPVSSRKKKNARRPWGAKRPRDDLEPKKKKKKRSRTVSRNAMGLSVFSFPYLRRREVHRRRA